MNVNALHFTEGEKWLHFGYADIPACPNTPPLPHTHTDTQKKRPLTYTTHTVADTDVLFVE